MNRGWKDYQAPQPRELPTKPSRREQMNTWVDRLSRWYGAVLRWFRAGIRFYAERPEAVVALLLAGAVWGVILLLWFD